MIKIACRACTTLNEPNLNQCPACGIMSPDKAPEIVPSAELNTTVNWIMWGIFLVIVLALYSCMKESPEEKQQKSVAAAKNKRAGFHCLSGWDGSHSSVVRQVKSLLRDPDSFEHVSTKLTPVDETGRHTLFMRYSAKNGFGGMTPGFATAIVINANCEATLATNE